MKGLLKYLASHIQHITVSHDSSVIWIQAFLIYIDTFIKNLEEGPCPLCALVSPSMK